MHQNEHIHEDALPQTEEIYENLIGSIKDYAIFMLDVYGNILTWNKGAEKIKGYVKHEVIGKHFSIFFTSEDIAKGCPEMELKIAKEEGKFEGEGWRVKKNKSLFWASVVITPIYNKNNQLVGFSKITKNITEKRKSEQKFKELQQKYQVIVGGVEHVKDYAIILLDENGYITSWNSGAERIKGYKPKEILGRHFSNFYPKNAVEAGYPDYELEKAVKDGRFEDEGWRIKKDGSQFWANVIITPIFQDKKLTGFIKVTRDLTEKIKGAKKLKETQEDYKLLLNSIQDYSIYMLDKQGIITSWNTGGEKVQGYKAEEIIGRHFSIFYPKKLIEERFPEIELQEALKHGSYEDQGWRVKKNGEIYWANIIITSIYKNDEHVGYSKVTRDLTEQKKIEKALKESEERYRLLVDGVKDYGIFMLDPYGYVATWNKGAEKIKGYTSEEILGKHFSIFYDYEAIAAGLPDYELAEAKETGRFEQEGWRLKKDGSKFWANVIINPMKDEKDRIIGYSKVVRDLTEMVKAENNLHKKNAELSKLNNDLDSFIYTASHDLKAPIFNIEGLISSLQKALPEELENNNKIKDILYYMNTSVNRFKRTIYDLSEITKLQQNIYAEPVDINMHEVFEDVKDSVIPLIESSDAKLTYHSSDGDIIRITKPSIRSILYNLISNSLKYRHPERTPEVVVSFTISEEYYIIKVSDNGLGIPSQHHKKIFAMFKRLHDKVEGTGVGLFIVKRIVDNMEGRIEIDSTPDEGSTFTIFLKKET